jgi:hypothetical protein
VVTSAWKCWPLCTLPTIHSLIQKKVPRTNKLKILRTDETPGFLMSQGTRKSKANGLEQGVQGVRQMRDRADMIQPMEIIRRRNRSNEKTKRKQS